MQDVYYLKFSLDYVFYPDPVLKYFALAKHPFDEEAWNVTLQVGTSMM